VEALLESTKKLVDATLTKLGLDAAAARVKDEELQTSWTLQRGSASVLITAIARPEQKGVFLRVASPVLVLPEGDHSGLFRRLLELNVAGLANAAFGVMGDRVIAVSERPAPGLDQNEVEQMIRHLSAVADTYDDRLVKEFGGRRASDKA
jgi:hypothetical protein